MNHRTDPFLSPEQEVDTVFSKKMACQPFSFNEEVVRVFPDMIRRSAPGYTAIVEQIGFLAPLFAQPHSRLYDLGSSLGAVSMVLRRKVTTEGCSVVALDNSMPMVEKSREYFNAQSMMHEMLLPVEVHQADITRFDYQPASLITLNFTLQFILPDERLPLLKKLNAALLPGGALILSEKICFEDEQAHLFQNHLHMAFKRANGYSELEVAQKRQALENVMLIDTFEQHRMRLLAAGFTEVYQWFQCLNFISIIAVQHE